MVRRKRIALVSLLSVFVGALSITAAGAETVMIVGQETVDGTSIQPPLPAVEGITSGLFAAGHVVFEAGKVGVSARTEDLEEIAREGKVDWLLRINVVYTQTKLEQNVLRVVCSATFSLVNAESGATSLSDKASATNKGREKSTDRAALGAEIGRLISTKVAKALAS
jgi:hypothetical protein